VHNWTLSRADQTLALPLDLQCIRVRIRVRMEGGNQKHGIVEGIGYRLYRLHK
jgi:hypothetical protein